jgi:hypothetical protein
VLAGVGTAFAVEPGGVVPTATPVGGGTPVAGSSLEITFWDKIPNAANTQIVGIIVTVHNKDTVPHSGIVNVAVDQNGATITGNASFSDLGADASTQITVNLGPISIGTYLETMRVIITQTS